MCLPGQSLMLPPTERGKAYGNAFRVATIGFAQVTSGLIDLILGVVGYLSVRNPESYNVQQTLCFFLFSVLRFTIAFVSLISFSAGVDNLQFSSKTYEILYYSLLCIATVYYFVMGYICQVIYNELRQVAASFVRQPPNQDGFDQPQAQRGNAAFPAPGNASFEAADASRKSKGFQAFQGTGHRLGS